MRLKKKRQPLKSSLVGKYTGLPALESHIEKCKTQLKNDQSKTDLKQILENNIKSNTKEKNFIIEFETKGIDVVIRRNESGRIYGITFIDHQSKTAWNESRLGKEFSANSFNVGLQILTMNIHYKIKSSLQKLLKLIYIQAFHINCLSLINSMTMKF